MLLDIGHGGYWGQDFNCSPHKGGGVAVYVWVWQGHVYHEGIRHGSVVEKAEKIGENLKPRVGCVTIPEPSPKMG